MQFENQTELASGRLRDTFLRHTAPYRHDALQVAVRHTRKADFSGACYYRDARIFVNVGRRNRYPYSFVTHVAKARTHRTHWSREALRLTVADPYQLALFVYLHELFHYLVKVSGRKTGRKEAMCDRFATRVLVDEYGCPLETPRGLPAPRELWDFQDLHGFVARAPKQPTQLLLPMRDIRVIIRGLPAAAAAPRARAL